MGILSVILAAGIGVAGAAGAWCTNSCMNTRANREYRENVQRERAVWQNEKTNMNRDYAKLQEGMIELQNNIIKLLMNTIETRTKYTNLQNEVNELLRLDEKHTELLKYNTESIKWQ